MHAKSSGGLDEELVDITSERHRHSMQSAYNEESIDFCNIQIVRLDNKILFGLSLCLNERIIVRFNTTRVG